MGPIPRWIHMVLQRLIVVTLTSLLCFSLWYSHDKHLEQQQEDSLLFSECWFWFQYALCPLDGLLKVKVITQ